MPRDALASDADELPRVPVRFPVRFVLVEPGGPVLAVVRPDPRCAWCCSPDHRTEACSDRKRRGGR